MSLMVVLTVVHKPGGRLPSGSPNGLGGKTVYRAAITTNGIDRQPVGPTFEVERDAQRYADRLQRRLDQENGQ